jgi:hypothetical protein
MRGVVVVSSPQTMNAQNSRIAQAADFRIKWRHQDGSTIEFSPRGWASDDPWKARWLFKMNDLCSSSPAICPVVRSWLREYWNTANLLTFNAASYNLRKLQLKPGVLQFLLQQPWRDQGSDLSPFPGKFDIAERNICERLSIDTTIYEQGEILAFGFVENIGVILCRRSNGEEEVSPMST